MKERRKERKKVSAAGIIAAVLPAILAWMLLFWDEGYRPELREALQITFTILMTLAVVFFTFTTAGEKKKQKEIEQLNILKMRRKIVAGNWKMNTTPEQGVELVKAVLKGLGTACGPVDYIVCPPYTHLSEVTRATCGTAVKVGAQNCAEEAKGAYTGEVSAEMIASLGVQYVILGHSERRQYYGETSATLNKRMKQAYANGLVPIYCVGETLEERESGKLWDVVKAQIEEVAFNLTEEEYKKLIIAYEPVWAIGTGKVATADQAQEMHAFIRKTLAAKFGAFADKTPILYGGSVKPDNAKEIFAKTDVDGGLIGGAALKAEDFLGIGAGF